EQRDQHVAAVHRVLAGAVDVHGGALQHAPERRRLLRLGAVLQVRLELLGEVDLELRGQPAEVGAAGAQDLRRRRIGAQRQEQVLQGQVFMVATLRLADGQLEGGLQLLADRHLLLSSSSGSSSGSMVQRSGYSAFSASAIVSETLASATP